MSVELAWRVDGPEDGQPLVLLHSLGCDHTMWDPQVAALSAERRILRVDLRGHGSSPVPAPPYTLAELADDVLRVADEAGLDRLDLAGISLGGQVALAIAARLPDRVRRLVAGATALRIGTPDGWDARIAAVREGGLEGLTGLALGRFFAPGFDGPAVDATRRVLLATAPSGYIGCCTALRDADLTEEARAITAPTLLLAGGADVSTPPTDLQDIADVVPGARIEVLPEVGHLLNLEAPDVVTDLIEAHLRG